MNKFSIGDKVIVVNTIWKNKESVMEGKKKFLNKVCEVVDFYNSNHGITYILSRTGYGWKEYNLKKVGEVKKSKIIKRG